MLFRQVDGQSASPHWHSLTHPGLELDTRLPKIMFRALVTSLLRRLDCVCWRPHAHLYHINPVFNSLLSHKTWCNVFTSVRIRQRVAERKTLVISICATTQGHTHTVLRVETASSDQVGRVTNILITRDWGYRRNNRFFVYLFKW